MVGQVSLKAGGREKNSSPAFANEELFGDKVQFAMNTSVRAGLKNLRGRGWRLESSRPLPKFCCKLTGWVKIAIQNRALPAIRALPLRFRTVLRCRVGL